MASLFESIASTVFVLPFAFGYIGIVVFPLLCIIGGVTLTAYYLLKHTSPSSEADPSSTDVPQLHIVPSPSADRSQYIEKKSGRPSRGLKKWNTYKQSEVS